MDDTRQWIEALYLESGPQLLIFLKQRVGDVASAEDLLQETFAAALRQADRLRSASSPRAYLFGMARNLAATASRKAWRRNQPLFIPEPQQKPQDPRLELLREAMTRLKPEFQEALELRLRHELSYEEIAEAINVPIGTVRSRLHHAVRQLRQDLCDPDRLPASRKEDV